MIRPLVIRFLHVVALLELALLVAADIAFVGPDIDRFPLAHDGTPLQLFL
jgi:hypothetical protein